MEPVLMLSYYGQLREHMCSSVNCLAGPEPESYPQQDRRQLVSAVTPPKQLSESTVTSTATQEEPKPAGLDDAFEAMTEEMKFDWPEFFDWKPVMIVKEVILGISLVAALLAFAILS